MAATLTNRYPLALERIVRGLTRVTLNPATILISLGNDYVHCGWLIQKGADLSTFSSTHGALDNLNSDGIVLSNFTPTRDTSSDRVAGQFDDFPGLRNFRAMENGAELVTKNEQALTRIAHEPFDSDYQSLPEDEVFLRVWSPQFTHLDAQAPVEATIEKVQHFSNAQNPSWSFQTGTRLGTALDLRSAGFLFRPLRLRKNLCAPVRFDSETANGVPDFGMDTRSKQKHQPL